MSYHRALLWCGAIGAPLFVVVFMIEDAVPAIRPPGYNPLRHPVSSLAIGPLGWIQVANFLATGVLLLAFAVRLRPALRRYNGGIWAPVLIADPAAHRTGPATTPAHRPTRPNRQTVTTPAPSVQPRRFAFPWC
jgi:hypothetical protein